MGNKPYQLLEITSEGCASCVTMNAVIQQIAKQRDDMSTESKNVKQFTQAQLQKLGVEKVPVLLLMCDQAVLGRVYGYQPYEILELWLESKIG